MREVEVQYEIDDKKCKECKDRPCLKVCPVDAIHEIPPDNHIEIDEKCIGCILCREACPYDAIKMKTILSEPIREPIPTINPKLCLNCGACVATCKTGAIELVASGKEEIHPVIDEEKCVRCGYCARSCPSEAIKYGEILPRAVATGKALVIDPKQCIGCMTCTRVCPSKGAIKVGKVSKLPYIDPAYCARCEKCMDVCPSTAIKYTTRTAASRKFNRIHTTEIVSEVLEKETEKIAEATSKINSILEDIANNIIKEHDEKEFEIDVTDQIKEEIKEIMDGEIEIDEIVEIIEKTKPHREIKSLEEKCIGCGACVDECPVKCIELEMPAPISIGEECVYCGKCVQVCPVKAIKIREEFFTVKDDKILFKRREIKEPKSGKVIHDNMICQACGICVNKCPVNALSLKDDKIIIDQETCISCGECENICPVNAIKLIENGA
ncbi:MAG: 4Fe-4S binding protein [Methanothermobacter sp.]|nr:4Fe-4S binding protein [Methanothermobacter sp.]